MRRYASRFLLLSIVITLPRFALALEPIFTLAPNDVPEGFGNGFGWSVAISGDYIAVGAPSDPWYSGDMTGAVYVFHRVGPRWIQQAKLVNPDPVFEAQFGLVVAMDGDVLAVGAPVWQAYYSCDLRGEGAVYIFRRDGAETPDDFSDDSWRQEGRLTAPDPRHGLGLGMALAVAEDLVVAGSDCGESAEVYTRGLRGFWMHETTLRPPEPGAYEAFGWAVGIEEQFVAPADEVSAGATWPPSNTAQRVVIGAPSFSERRGAVYVFTLVNGAWGVESILTVNTGEPKDDLGRSVGISCETIFAGAPHQDNVGPHSNSGAVHVFEQSAPGQWNWASELTPGAARELGEFGSAMACHFDQCLFVPNISWDRGVYLFRRVSNEWREVERLHTTAYPTAVALEGNYSVVGDGIYVVRNRASLREFALFQACLGEDLALSECHVFDLAFDTFVDLSDFAEFAAVLGGP